MTISDTALPWVLGGGSLVAAVLGALLAIALGRKVIETRPYLVECPDCDGAAMSQAALDEHLRVRHGDS